MPRKTKNLDKLKFAVAYYKDICTYWDERVYIGKHGSKEIETIYDLDKFVEWVERSGALS